MRCRMLFFNPKTRKAIVIVCIILIAAMVIGLIAAYAII